MGPDPRYDVIVVGLGAQGRGIVTRLQELGHHVVAGVDIGDHVGRRVADIVEGFTGDAIVYADAAVASDAHAGVRVAAIAAAIDLPTTLAIAGPLLDRGVNVVTLNDLAFSFDPSWATQLDARARAGGASFMGVGVQDASWVHLLTLSASVVDDITSITLTNLVPLETLSATIGDVIGIGLTPDEFSSFAARSAEEPSVIGLPLIEAARRMGATAVVRSKRVEPVIGSAPYEWVSGAKSLPAGVAQGTREVVTLSTDRGFDLIGVMESRAGHDVVAEAIVEFAAEPALRVTFGPITWSVTNTALIARIPDVVEADAGVLFSADLHPAKHQFRSPAR